jgi:hypothetical protein
MILARARHPLHVLAYAAIAAALLSVIGLAESACGNSPTPTRVTATNTSTSPAASPTTTSGGYVVNVYFSRHPDSDNDVAAVFPVMRVSPTPGVGTFAMQQLIAGPTSAEMAAGYYSELGGSLSGTSNCGGADFQYSIDNATHTGTLRFCRQTMLAGDLVGGRIKAEINATLKQFSNVTKVVILNSTGHCFDDLSGMDACLH